MTREHVATASAGVRIPLFQFLSELKRCAAFRASKMRWCLCEIHRGLLDRWAPGQTNMLHFASINSLVVIIRPFLIKQAVIFSANWLYFPWIERSAFRFCQSCILQPEQPAETCADSGKNQSQKHYTCSPFAPEPDSLVNFRTYSDVCTLKFRLSSFAPAFAAVAAVKWKCITGYRAGPREMGS